LLASRTSDASLVWTPVWSYTALRHSRACFRFDYQWYKPWWFDSRLCRNVSHLFRLHAPSSALICTYGCSFNLCVDPRFNRLGEDGPTHQPIEHLAALRAIPNLDIVRPADANEVAEAWKTILS